MTPAAAATAGVRLERPSAHVARLVLDRPPRNALGQEARRALLSRLDALASDGELRAVVLTGARESFCSGDDLAELRLSGGATTEGLAEWAEVFDRLERMAAPVVAAVNGWAIGGGLELALCCDIRIASNEALLAAAGVKVGLMASAYRLPRLIGVARAKAMLLTGDPVDAGAALASGLIAAVHAPESLQDAALDVAERIASRAPQSVRAAKALAAAAPDLDRDAGLARMARMQRALAATADHGEAVAAFADKRPPVFTGA